MATNAWPRCEKCGHEIASDTDWCRCPENAALHRSDPTLDLVAIRARLDALVRVAPLGQAQIPCADLAAILAAFDAQAARLAAAEQALRTVLDPIEDGWIDQDDRDQAAVQIRYTLGLCTSGGCNNPRGAHPDSDGYCAECLEAPDATD